ncbi:MAG: glycine cleavage system protein GcvH [Myxococcota bacterium]|nr:glycine cleavage system protein GcvH [Myxococcales bacterium]
MADYELPDENFYSSEDEWVRVEGKRAYVGITDYAQDQLGDIVFVELPTVGTTLQQGDTFGVVESVKAVSDLYAPISGEVVEVNEDLADSPEAINESCYGDGWMIVIEPSDTGEFDSLMNSADYLQYIKDRQE